MSTAELHTLTGAYALHALSEAERDEFERHLTQCSSCAQEVRELSATAARLGLALTETPPPEMRERVLNRVATVRQEPPAPGGGGGVRPGWKKRARTLPRLTLAACLAAAALGGVAVWQYDTARDAREQSTQAERRAEQRSRDVARVLTAADAKTVNAKGLPGGGSGTVVVSQSRNEAAFVASGMSAPPSGKVYQLWFDDGGGSMRSAGLMDSSGESAAVLMKGKVDGASGMGITVEPSGGSPQPTSDPVALMGLPV